MTQETSTLPKRLSDICAEFDDVEPRERLELLLDFARNLPELPAAYRALRDAGQNQVEECQTPVFLWVELSDGKLQLYADVAEGAPTVKGFVALLVEALSGASPEEVYALPSNLLGRLGLIQALGMVRMRGLSAIVARVRFEAQKARTAQQR